MELFSDILYYLLPFLLVLTILVFVHEFGHFIVARFFGVRVKIFSIGFGRELFGFNDRYGTRWKFSLIPLGGYIKMFGDKSEISNADTALVLTLSEEERKTAFACKSLPIKAAIVAAGPLANYLLAIIIFAAFFFCYGAPNTSSIISNVVVDSPANKAGIITGDIIVKIDNQNITSFNDIQNIMLTSVGSEINIIIKRGDEIIDKKITPQKFTEEDILGNKASSYKLGLLAERVTFEKTGIFTSLKLASVECYELSMLSFRALGQILTGQRSAKELSGPIKIAQYSAKSAQMGIQALIWFVALLSVNLGMMNLLPIPALDGGHLLLYCVEAVFGKKIAQNIENFTLQIGIIILIMVTIFVTINDVSSLRLFKD